ncbi:MAG: hypothetical protein CMF22_10505 [Idiomarinaceae bacterium]|nr:hypothetical protein [Idiomarinaceae bacterium]MBG23871.1 hypothetical protein [Idiomarinaceae bacterium]|tara:strand:- start:8078 stop:8380 length:303 start_codon:yes stop_codon:yes gene_type:complete
MSKKVILNIESVKAAAQYLAENNHFINRSEDRWEKEIYKKIARHVTEEDVQWVMTGGLTLIFSNVGDEFIEVEVLVSPSFGVYSFVEADILDEKLVVNLG